MDEAKDSFEHDQEKQTREELTALRSRVETLEQDRQEAQAFAKEMRDFASKMQILSNAQVTESRKTRESFISTFRRDKLLNANEADYNIIREGNTTTSVHGGNALMDMYLFTPKGRRTDHATFTALYGLNPSQVERVAHCDDIIRAINEHASLYASNFQVLTQRFHDAFEAFAAELIRSDLRLNLNEPINTLTRLYWEFWEATKTVGFV